MAIEEIENRIGAGLTMSEAELFDRGIQIDGYWETWHIIDAKTDYLGKKLFLLEHDLCGDEAACIIVDENRNVILDEVWNGWGDLEDAIATGEFDYE